MKSYQKFFLISLVIALLTYLTGTVLADTTYNESINGDLSGDRLNPTTLTLTPGSNLLTATSVAGDLEYVSVTVPPGFQLNSLILAAYTSSNTMSFIAVQSGPTFTESPATANVSNLLGYSHFGTGLGQVGTDILDDIGGGAGAIGFTGPLPSGRYTFWLQEEGGQPATYSLNFVVSPSTTTALYDEATDGDLSGDRLNPTAISLVEGGNTLASTSVAGDVDYVTISVPSGFELEAILLQSFVSTDDLSFVAIQSGSTFTEPANGTNVANLLGYTHFGTGLNQVNTDILDDIAAGPGAIGFTPPLPGGTYTLWLQETGVETATYTLNLVVSREKVRLYLPILFR